MAKEEELSFLEKLFPFLRNPEQVKKRKLKKISQALSRSKYKFYKYRTQEITPEFPKFLIEIYKITSSASSILKDAEKSETLKKVVIEHYLKDNQKKYLLKLAEEEIIAFAGEKDMDTISKTLTGMIGAYQKEFSKEMIDNINSTYNQILDFLSYLKYDMPYLIKRFLTTNVENVTSNITDAMLRAISAKSVSLQIKDLYDAFYYVSGKKNWKDMIIILSKFKEINILEYNHWTKILKEIEYMLSNDIILNMVRCIDEKPDFEFKKLTSTPLDIAKDDFENITKNVETALYKIASDRKNAKISQICQAIFGNDIIPPLEYFNEKLNADVLKKGIAYLQYFDSLAITKHFLIEFFKKDCKDLQDIILIRATWTSKGAADKALAAYQNLLELTTKVISFDKDMSSQGQYGSKLKKSLNRINDRSILNKKQCEEIIASINQYALKLLRIIATDLIVFGKCIKAASDDLALKEPKIITNWRELEVKSGKEDLKGFIDNSYKKIYYFIQILKIDIPD